MFNIKINNKLLKDTTTLKAKYYGAGYLPTEDI